MVLQVSVATAPSIYGPYVDNRPHPAITGFTEDP